MSIYAAFVIFTVLVGVGGTAWALADAARPKARRAPRSSDSTHAA